MASLAKFKINSKAVNDGEWVSPGDEYDDLMIKTRGFTNAYQDARTAKMRQAARRYSGDMTKVPSAMADEITIECMIDHCLLDVKNLLDKDQQPVDIERLKELLFDPDYQKELFNAIVKAAAIAGVFHDQDVEDAKKNSVKR